MIDVRRLALTLAGLALVLGALAASSGEAAAGTTTVTAVAQDWPQYLYNSTHDGFTPDNAITATKASSLAPRPGWPVRLGGGVSTQPVVANGLVYSGSWDGNEYAVRPSGAVAWKAALGRTTPASASCSGTIGVASTAAVASVALAGHSQPSPVLFVGGGGNDAAGGGSAKVVALDATTGARRWQTVVGPSPSTFIWSSPLVLTPAGATVPSVYVGVSSYADCPLVPGRLLAIDARTGSIQHEFDVVPRGCVGGGIWGSPTFDPTDGSLYVATGNPASCALPEPYAAAMVKLRASDLSVVASWQVPAAEMGVDSDFGSTPTLFGGTVTRGAAARRLVGVGNKNGVFYVFDRTRLAQGPVARVSIAVGGDCPQCGQGTISPAAFDGRTLYVGGGAAVSGSTNKGVVKAFDPNNLTSPRWVHTTGQPVIAALTAAPGILVAGEGSDILVINPATGATLSRLHRGTAKFYGAPSIAHGVLYEGDIGGSLWAYSVNGG